MWRPDGHHPSSSYSAFSSPLTGFTIANVKKASSTSLLRILEGRCRREIALHIAEQTIYNILLKYFHSSKLVLGHGHMLGSWVFFSLFPSLVDPSFPPSQYPLLSPTSICSSFYLPWSRIIQLCLSFTFSFFYVNSIIMPRRLKVPVSRMYITYKAILICDNVSLAWGIDPTLKWHGHHQLPQKVLGCNVHHVSWGQLG